MALIKCKHCGGLLSTLAEKCPHCGTPVDKEAPQPVEKPQAIETPNVSSDDEPQPSPQPAQNDEQNYEEEESHTGRNLMIIVLVLVLAIAGGYYYYQQSGSNCYESDMDSIAVSDTVVAEDQPEAIEDSIAICDTVAVDTIPSFFVLKGEMAGYPMSVSGQRDDGNSFHGTYHNLTYGTEMYVEGYITDGSLSFSGSVQGESFDFTLHKTSSEGRYEGLCRHSEERDLSVWLEMQ